MVIWLGRWHGMLIEFTALAEHQRRAGNKRTYSFTLIERAQTSIDLPLMATLAGRALFPCGPLTSSFTPYSAELSISAPALAASA